VVLPGGPLTLLPDARLDRLRDRYVLIGADEANLGGNVRWATLDAAAGQLGAEHTTLVETAHKGLWFALAGTAAPGDAVLAGVGLLGATPGDLEIHVVSQPADGSAAAMPGGQSTSPAVATLPGGALPGARPLVAMASSRLGMAAALAWVDAKKGAVMLAALGGNGQPVTAPQLVDTAPAFGCLSFTPSGKDELTLGYYKYVDANATTPSWVIAEVRESGAIDSTLTLTLESADARCPLVTATDNGYAMAWQDSAGSWLGVYDSRTNRLQTYPFASALDFHGADLQPPLVGLAPLGKEFAVVLAKARSAELWRLDPVGSRRPGALGFPSLQGDMGGISSLPVAGSLYATYADYTAIDGGVGTSGQRYFVKASCF
jgi:hypothetical protein